MMPKPNPNKRKEHQNRSEFNTSEKILLETKPSFWLYSDNFILKIVVLFILVFMFSPIMAFVYVLHEDLVENFHIAVDNVMFYTELLLFLLILVVLIKLILDVLIGIIQIMCSQIHMLLFREVLSIKRKL